MRRKAALCVMLSLSMVGSLGKLEVFSESIRQMKETVNSLQEFLEMPELPEPEKKAELNGYDVEIKNVRFSYTDKKRMRCFMELILL